MPQFADQVDFELHFQPFQLYPNLPPGDNAGVDKRSFWKSMGKNSSRSEVGWAFQILAGDAMGFVV